MEHVGIDVHQKYSEICWLSEDGEVKLRRRLPTTETSLRRLFGRRSAERVGNAVTGYSFLTSTTCRSIAEPRLTKQPSKPKRTSPASGRPRPIARLAAACV